MRESLFIKFLLFFFMILKSTPQNAQSSKQNDKNPTNNECIAILTNAMKSGETIFIKVHAAEALIYNNYYKGIDSTFKKLVKEPGNLIVATRVLARTNTKDPAKYKSYINTLLYQLEHADSTRGKLIALESLAKIGFDKPTVVIKNYADTGTNGFKAMARWVLANSCKRKDEATLAALLSSNDPTEYRGAAYALRFFKKVSPQTLSLLSDCAQIVEIKNPARVYVLSSLFVHAATSGMRQVTKDKLLTYLNGAVGEKYEVAEALATAGTQQDVSTVQKLLEDENTDVIVAAAKALLSIQSKRK